MRRILILAAFCIILSTNIANAMTTNEYVSALEQKLFGVTYTDQTLTNRIDRIEMQIYDNSYSGSAEERLAKIDKIYPKSEFETGKIETANSYNQQFPETKLYKQDYPEVEEKADYNNYPIVSEIEQSIYQNDFKGEDIYKRLARLEKELYGNVKNDQSLQERVAALKSVLPKKHYNRFAAENMGFKDFGLNMPASYSATTDSAGEYFNSSVIINELEMQTFNRAYADEHLAKRIERLENYYFGGVSMGQNEDDRINRLASVVMNNKGINGIQMPKGSQWAGILMNLLVIGLGLLL